MSALGLRKRVRVLASFVLVAVVIVAWWPAPAHAGVLPPLPTLPTLPPLPIVSTLPPVATTVLPVPVPTTVAVTAPVTVPATTTVPVTVPVTVPATAPVTVPVTTTAPAPTHPQPRPAATPTRVALPVRADPAITAPGGYAPKAARAARALRLPIAISGLVLGFLLLHGRIDRHDPRLAAAPVSADEDVLTFP